MGSDPGSSRIKSESEIGIASVPQGASANDRSGEPALAQSLLEKQIGHRERWSLFSDLISLRFAARQRLHLYQGLESVRLSERWIWRLFSGNTVKRAL
jgi:hypothetical protein